MGDLYLCGSTAALCKEGAGLVSKWITPYGREGRWLSNATAALPMLLRGSATGEDLIMHLHSNWWQNYIITLSFWLRRAETNSPMSRGAPLARIPLWEGGLFNAAYNEAHSPRIYDVPARTT